MNRVKPTAVKDVRDFFSDQIQTLLQKHNVSAEQESFEYLVDLMVRHMESEQFFAKDEAGRPAHNTLAHLYAEYLSGNAEQKRVVLRRLGDICLLVSGFFPDSLNRKLIDVDYYFGMGGTAYQQLSSLQMTKAARKLYQELSSKFKTYAEVLGELSDRTGVQTNADLLRLYEKWLLTGSDRLRVLLSEHGIHTVKVDAKTRH